MSTNKMSTLAEAIDRLLTVDINLRGVIGKLYEAARSLTQEPLSLKAVEELRGRLKPGDRVLIMTGFRVPPWYVQETDGPLGAACLAKALSLAFDVRPLLMIEGESRDVLAAAVRGFGLTIRRLDEVLKEGRKYGVALVDFVYDSSKAHEEAKRLLDELSPSAVISIEKAGRSAEGRYYTMRGLDVSDYHLKVEPIVEEARRRGVLTIGIGDGGNEVGMGNIAEAVRRYVPLGDRIAAESKVDVLVVSTVSNWGAYGMATLIAKVLNNRLVLHDERVEEFALALAVGAGAVDGVTGLASLSVDSLNVDVHKALVRVLNAMFERE